MIANLHYKSLIFTVKTKVQGITVERLKAVFREGLQKNLKAFEKKVGPKLKETINLLLLDTVSYKLYGKKENLEEWKDDVLIKDLNLPKEIDQSGKGLVVDFQLVAIHNFQKAKDFQEKSNVEELIAKATGATSELKSHVKRTVSDEFVGELGGELDDMMLLSTILNLRNSGNNNTSNRREFLTRILTSITNGGSNNPLASLLTRSSDSPNMSSLRIPIRLPNVEPDQDLVNQLIEMGFPEDRSRRSLIMTRNNIEAAVELIANDQDLDSSQPSSQLQSNNNIIEVNEVNETGEDETN